MTLMILRYHCHINLQGQAVVWCLPIISFIVHPYCYICNIGLVHLYNTKITIYVQSFKLWQP